MKKKLHLILIPIFLFISCTRHELVSVDDAYIRVKAPSDIISDDLNFKDLEISLSKNISQLKKIPPFEFSLKEQKVSSEKYILSLQNLLNFLSKTPSPNANEISIFIKENFNFYAIYGDEKPGEVLLTSYYAPVIKGSKTKTQSFEQPLYSTPPNLVKINLKEFKEQNILPEAKKNILRGMLNENKIIVPYYSRENIDSKGKLETFGNEIIHAYVGKLDAFFMHIQGSGVVEFPDGKKLTLGYEEQNGRNYISIGKFHAEKNNIPPEEITMPKLISYLKSLSKEEQEFFLNQNESYIFFKKIEGNPITTFGTEVIPGRTIATDGNFFPKGTIAFLYFDHPEFSLNENHDHPTSFKPASRIVFDQDTGGAIKGGGRVDLFWGEGDSAKKYAGVIRQKAKLYYLFPKN